MSNLQIMKILERMQFYSTLLLLRVVRTRAVLVTWTAMDVRSGVGLVRTYRERGGNRGGDPSRC